MDVIYIIKDYVFVYEQVKKDEQKKRKDDMLLTITSEFIHSYMLHPSYTMNNGLISVEVNEKLRLNPHIGVLRIVSPDKTTNEKRIAVCSFCGGYNSSNFDKVKCTCM